METITLNSINLKENRIIYDYSISEKLKKFFVEYKPFELQYSIDVRNVPESILVIPFLCNILPLIWITNSSVKVDKIDKDFYDHIDDIKEGYCNMLPQFEFKGEVCANEIINNVLENKSSAVFFSGGMDATTTLMRHLNEKPDLITLWGSDISLDDNLGWNNVINHIKDTAEKYDLYYWFVKSNFRQFINYVDLDRLVNACGDSWWHAFQHGIGLIAHAAPVAYLRGYKNLYIASSYTESMKGTYTCASDPSIDDNVHFCGNKTTHDGYEMTRQEKAKYLVLQQKKMNQVMNLRVCYMEAKGKNCCRCEKCYRSILEIISEGGDPNKFGLPWKKSDIPIFRINMLTKITTATNNINAFWIPIQNGMKKNKKLISNFDDYKWLIDLDLNSLNDYPVKRIRRKFSRIKRSFLSGKFIKVGR